MENDWKYWHKQYDEADWETKNSVENAFEAATDELSYNPGLKALLYDDRAEKLVAAIMEYLTECRKTK